MSDKAKVKITGKRHPHKGEEGHVERTDKGEYAARNIMGQLMVRVELIDCKHGTGSCFAKPTDLQLAEDLP
jgi:hypothetical protein